MRVLRALVASVASVLVLVVGVALAVILVLDDDDYRRIASYAVERLTGRTLIVDGTFSFDLSLEPSLQVTEVRVQNPTWATQPDLARVGRLEVQLALRPLLSGTLLIPRLVLEDADFDLETGPDGARNWTTAAGEEDAGDDEDQRFLVPVLGTVGLRNVTWRYRDAASGWQSAIELDHLTIEQVGGVGRLDGAGLWDDRAIGAKGEFGTLTEALNPTQPFPLDLALSLPNLQLALHGTVAEPATGEGLALHLTGQSDDVAKLLGALGSDLAIAGRLDGAAQLSGDLAALQLADLRLALTQDESGSEPSVQVTGQIATVRPGDSTPVEGLDLELKLATSTTVLAGWLGHGMPDLGPVDGRLTLTGDARALKVADGRLEIGRTGGPTLIASGGIETIQLGPELMVRGVAVDLEAKAPTTAALARPLGVALPELGAVAASGRLTGGRERLDLEQLVVRAGTAGRPIQVSGQIDDLLLQGKAPATATLEGALAPLLGGLLARQLPDLGRVRATAQMAAASGELRIEQLHVVADGSDVLSFEVTSVAGEALDDGWPEIEVDLGAKDLSIFGTLLDRTLPPLGPFSYRGRLAGYPSTPHLSGQVRLGQTEIEADVAVSFGGARPSISGKLSTPVLYVADLGIRPDGPWQATGLAEAPGAGQASPDDRPPPLPFAALQTLDLSLLVQIDQIEGVDLSIDRGTITIALEDGLLRVDPARFDYVGGSFSVEATVDSRSDPPQIALDVTADDVRLGAVFAQIDKVVPIEGELDVQLSLKSQGSSLPDLTASLEGELAMAIERGQITISYFDLAGANLLHWLFGGTTTRDGTDLRCFIGQMDIAKGVADSKTLLLETSLTISKGTGSIDLVAQTLDILVRPHSRGARLEITTPYRIHGPLSDPSIEYNRGRLMARVVEELVLSPIHTLQTLLPLISDGGKDNNNPCLDWAPAPPATAMPAAATEPAAGIEPAAGGFPVDDLAPAPYVATTGSHVRDGPGTTHTVITTLATGATVQVTGKARGLDWYRVTLADGSVGFVWGKLLQPAAPSDTR